VIGALFVDEYYRILAEEPGNLHKFYKENSIFSRGTEGDVGAAISAVGPEEINSEVMAQVGGSERSSRNSRACRTQILGIASQESLQGGVLVLVTGYLSYSKDVDTKYFTQVFFLDKQTEPFDGFYVLNDMLRYSPSVRTAAAVQCQAGLQRPPQVHSQPQRPPQVAALQQPQQQVGQPAAEHSPQQPAYTPPQQPPHQLSGTGLPPAAASYEEGTAAEQLEPVVEEPPEGAEANEEEEEAEAGEDGDMREEEEDEEEGEEEEDEEEVEEEAVVDNTAADAEPEAIAEALEDEENAQEEPRTWASMAEKLRQGPGSLQMGKAKSFIAPKPQTQLVLKTGQSGVPTMSKVHQTTPTYLTQGLPPTTPVVPVLPPPPGRADAAKAGGRGGGNNSVGRGTQAHGASQATEVTAAGGATPATPSSPGSVRLWVTRLPDRSTDSQEILACINMLLEESGLSGNTALEVDRRDTGKDWGYLVMSSQEAGDAVVQLSKDKKLVFNGQKIKAEHQRQQSGGGNPNPASARRGRGGSKGSQQQSAAGDDDKAIDSKRATGRGGKRSGGKGGGMGDRGEKGEKGSNERQERTGSTEERKAAEGGGGGSGGAATHRSDGKGRSRGSGGNNAGGGSGGGRRSGKGEGKSWRGKQQQQV